MRLPEQNIRYGLLVMLAMCMACLMLVACAYAIATSPDSTIPSADTSGAGKISPLLKSAAQQLMQGSPPSLLHTGLVRTDNQGRLQVYVYVSALTPENVSALSAKGLVSAMPSPALHLVQGWLQPQDLGAIAALSFVTRITPPKYAQPR